MLPVLPQYDLFCCMLINRLIFVSSSPFALVSEVGGISEETAACDWWSLGAILFELLTGMVSQKVLKKCVFVAKVLWDVCRCLGFQLSHTLYGLARSCVILRVCLYVFEPAEFVAFGVLCTTHACVWGASWLPSLTLVLGECQGCRCDFLPQPELHLLGQGVSSPRASLLAPGAAPGLEHADLRWAWKVKSRAALEGATTQLVPYMGCLRDHLLRQAWEEGEPLFGRQQIHIQLLHKSGNTFPFCWVTSCVIYTNYNFMLSWRTNTHTVARTDTQCRCSSICYCRLNLNKF